MFDDDTLTNDKAYAIELSKHMKRLNLSWACNARAHVDYDTLKTLRDNGLRVALVGFESGNQEILYRIKKGLKLEMAREFMKNCHKLGIKVHGTFIIGLPVDTPETVRETIEFAKELDPHRSRSRSPRRIPARNSTIRPWPTAGSRATTWFRAADSNLDASLRHALDRRIEDSVERMYREFYFRPKKIASIVAEMVTNRQMLVRRLREGGEFFGYLRERQVQAGERRREALPA